MSSRPNRETAYRVFAAEFDDATLSYAESDEERAPNYVVTPTGARLNRLFAVGVLTEIEAVNDEQLRARVVDPTGAFVVYAGQYQPEALSFLERADTPAFVAVTGKARTFRPEDADRVFTSIRPESLSEVDAATRDRFAVDAAERTIERVRTMRAARDRDERGDALRDALEGEGVERGLAAGIPRALAHYDTTPTYLDAIEELALDAARVVAGEREEVGSLAVAPDERSPERAAPTDAGTDGEPDAATALDEADTEPAAETSDDSIAAESADADVGTTSATDSAGEAEPERSVELESDREPEPSVEAETDVEPDVGDGPGPGGEGGDGVDESFGEIEEPSDEIAAEADDEEAIESNIGDPEEFELDPDERERIEEEYGTDFESAAEVGEPGEADIETPMPEESDEAGSEPSDPALDPESKPEGEGESAGAAVEDGIDETNEVGEIDESDTADDDEPDPEEAVVAAMTALNDGDGAEREAVIERVGDEHGLTPEAVDEGIQSALMSGECYEPDDDTLKPI